MKYLVQYRWTFVGIILGAIVGYLYYYYVGCASGTCMISSKPINSTLYFGMMGGLAANIFQKK